jgi:hypothetical protein
VITFVPCTVTCRSAVRVGDIDDDRLAVMAATAVAGA